MEITYQHRKGRILIMSRNDKKCNKIGMVVVWGDLKKYNESRRSRWGGCCLGCVLEMCGVGSFFFCDGFCAVTWFLTVWRDAVMWCFFAWCVHVKNYHASGLYNIMVLEHSEKHKFPCTNHKRKFCIQSSAQILCFRAQINWDSVNFSGEPPPSDQIFADHKSQIANHKSTSIDNHFATTPNHLHHGPRPRIFRPRVKGSSRYHGRNPTHRQRRMGTS